MKLFTSISFRLAIFYVAGLAGLTRPITAEPSAFLSKYCLECHDADTEKGDRSFEELSFPIKDIAELVVLQEIIDQLNLGEMPPKKAEQPSEQEHREAIAALTREAAEARTRLKSSGGQTVLRRLNEREYLNTLEDLFLRRIDTFAPTSTFPGDQTDHHVDTIGDALVTSSFLLSNYFNAADQVVEKALGTIEKPEVKSWHFNGQFTQGQELSYSHKKVYNFRYLCLYEVPNTVNHEGGYGGLEKFPEGVHADGFYEVKVLAHSVHRDTHYDPTIFRMDFAEPFRLGIVSGDSRAGALHHPQPIEPQLAEVTVADGDPRWYTMKVWLEKGQQPRFIFPNGMANCRGAFGQLARKYKNEWPKDDAVHRKPGIVEARRVVLEHGKMPHIRIHEVKIDGPLFEEWPPAPQKLVLGEGAFDSHHRQKILEKFAARAYRRPPSKDEVARLVQIANARIKKGHSPRQATMDAIKTSLCSPGFLYLSEAENGAGNKLGSHDLASRLSYFLWASMPDSKLRQLADSGAIQQPEILAGEMSRLLNDPRSTAFYNGFLDSWLNLRDLGGMPPERSASAPYFYHDLEKAMKLEVQHYAANLVQQNGSFLDFIDSDYSYLNHHLAQLYGEPFDFPISERNQFHRVKLKSQRRGGLLGMGAVLTVSANGIETSPVVRGVYVLENILGTPTPPPPDVVPAIETDTRGTKTIRDELEKHRETKTCAECHQQIDPIGFALENFDPIGRWRTNYPGSGKKKGLKIDASGVFPDGTKFTTIKEFRTLLHGRGDLFARHLTEQLLAYATGRTIGPLDRPVVDQIVAQSKAEHNGLRTLLEAVVQSEIFRSR